MNKRLCKSRNDRIVAGVCGGLAQFFGLDSTIIRVIWAVMICMGGSGLLLYILCAVVIPNNDDGSSYQTPSYRDNQDDANGWR